MYSQYFLRTRLKPYNHRNDDDLYDIDEYKVFAMIAIDVIHGNEHVYRQCYAIVLNCMICIRLFHDVAPINIHQMAMVSTKKTTTFILQNNGQKKYNMIVYLNTFTHNHQCM